jgi:hypothetical protein
MHGVQEPAGRLAQPMPIMHLHTLIRQSDAATLTEAGYDVPHDTVWYSIARVMILSHLTSRYLHPSSLLFLLCLL